MDQISFGVTTSMRTKPTVINHLSPHWGASHLSCCWCGRRGWVSQNRWSCCCCYCCWSPSVELAWGWTSPCCSCLECQPEATRLTPCWCGQTSQQACPCRWTHSAPAAGCTPGQAIPGSRHTDAAGCYSSLWWQLMLTYKYRHKTGPDHHF